MLASLRQLVFAQASGRASGERLADVEEARGHRCPRRVSAPLRCSHPMMMSLSARQDGVFFSRIVFLQIGY